jgi:allantoate deiminase
MVVRRDAIGNLIGRYEGDHVGGPTLLIASHLDSVRDAGRYDGVLGVICGIETVDLLREKAKRLPFAIEVIAFSEEEGVRYGTAYLASSVMAGTFMHSLLSRHDRNGVTLANAIRAFDGDPDCLQNARRDRRDLIGYLEVHIEQGPVLEQHDSPVGVVSGIIGRTRAEVQVIGVAGHAGTVPMHSRRDALAAAAEIINIAEEVARDEPGAVVTVGNLAVEPGDHNVIPGKTSFPLDVRHFDDKTRVATYNRIRSRADGAAAVRQIELRWELLQQTPTVPCSTPLRALLKKSAADVAVQALEPASGGGHDAVVMSGVTEAAMLFTRCAGGVSHNPAEAVSEQDVTAALLVVSRFLENLESSQVRFTSMSDLQGTRD